VNLVPYSVQGFNSGLEQNKKPFALIDTAFPQLTNAYCWRERILKREGLKLAGRYRRYFFKESIGNSAASPWTFNIYSSLTPAITPETNAQIQPGSVVIYVNAVTVTGSITGYTNAIDCEVTSVAHGLSTGDLIEITDVVVIPGTGPDDINNRFYTITVTSADTFTLGVSSQTWGTYSSGGTWTEETAAAQKLIDNGDGTLDTDPASATVGIINYITGDVTLTNATAGVATTITFGYFPGLPSMGIVQRERVGINDEQTIFFDTKYAYIHDGNEFQEFIPGTTWSGTDSDFFWATNYRGIEPADRLMFVTNFVINTEGVGSLDPIRYTDGLTWTDFNPILGTQETTEEFTAFTGGAGPYMDTLAFLPVPGTLTITVQTESEIIFRDTPKDGTLVSSDSNTGTINYTTGDFTLNFNPALPTGVITNITNAANAVVTSANHGLTSGDRVLIAGVAGMTEVNGVIFTITVVNVNEFKLNVDSTGFGVYGGGGTWVPEYEVEATYRYGTTRLYQARILLPYYGRLLAFNVWEGTSPNECKNIFNRCRFSQTGDPLQVDGWRSDVFGKGGFIDAPVNEEIISAIFYKNTLIVFFENTTWQLRYVGDYGLPFIWERISSDFGSESTFSTILFDSGVLAVGDRAIVSSSGNNIERIDLSIPDKVFSFNNAQNGVKRVHGIRDYQKELVFWTYSDGDFNRKFPNFSLVYNYRNNTYAIFRNNVTTYGYLKAPGAITWDNQTVTWDDPIPWDQEVIENFPLVVSGNQHGFVHFYGYPDVENTADSVINALDQESLFITAIDLTVMPIEITVPDHNLEDEEIVYMVGLNFFDSGAPASTDLNNSFYTIDRIDNNTLALSKYNITNNSTESTYSFTPVSTATYIGGGMLALFPKLDIRTKDFNFFDKKGISSKLAYVDFLIDAQENSQFTVKLFVNSRTGPEEEANILIGNQNVSQALTLFGNITGVTLADPGVITTQLPHGLETGDSIKIQNINGTVELNDNDYIVTSLSSNTFSINQDTTAYTPYISGGNYVQTNYTFYIPTDNYAWQRYYGGCNGQFIAVNITYNNQLMNTLTTHQQLFVLNSLKMWVKEGTRSIF
jgi:hypothetical protein